MNKVIKTIFIISIVVLGAGILTINSAQAQTPPNIIVEVWDEAINGFKPLAGNPIFNVSNFLPGETKTERIRVTNNTSQNQWVGLRVVNFDRGCVGSYCLADKLYLTVKEVSGSDLYSGSLTTFYQAGEVPLSLVNAGGSQVQYDLSVYFEKETAEKEYEGATAQFDLEIGFFTKETVSAEPFGGGGGGGYIPPIPGVVTQIIISGPPTLNPDSATVSLTTDIPSYCRIIYDIVSHSVLENPPNYGYAFSTPPTSTKSAFHSITLSNLEPATTYYYRAVCWASPLKISQEYSFTTLGVKAKEQTPKETQEIQEKTTFAGAEIPTTAKPPTPVEEIKKPKESILQKEKTPEQETIDMTREEGATKKDWSTLLLASLGEIGKTPWMLILIIFCSIVLIIIAIREWELFRKKKKNKS